MKSKAIIFLLALSLIIPIASIKAATANNLKGQILLQVESKGEAWYVNPKNGERYYLADGNAAFNVMKTLGVGMSNQDIAKMKTDATYRKQFIGKILLQVQSHGEAYYISSNGRYNYLKDGTAAYNIMRKLGLGISNNNLNKIPEYTATSSSSTQTNCGKDLNCFLKAIKTCTPTTVEITQDKNMLGMFIQNNTQTISLTGFDSSKKCGYSTYTNNVNSLSYSPAMQTMIKAEIAKQGKSLTTAQMTEALKVPDSAVASAKSTIGITIKCSFDTSYLTSLYEKWGKGSYDSSDMTPGNCTATDKSGKSVPML